MNKVGEWLDSLGLGKYAGVFADNSVEWDLVTKLSPDDLKELGLNIGERRRFIDAAATLVNQRADSTTSKSPPTVPVSRDAERRQLTVMFCDLVGSTDLSGQLDPEDLREVVRAYQKSAETAIQRFGGHIAQYLGDGLLVYFGYPRANEDDAQRAVHASVGIGRAIKSLNTQLQADYSISLAVRIGIHTGPVVVGEMGGDIRHENLAMGETPNLAARLQGLAEPGEVVISENTRRLLGELFALKPLGTQNLKGIAAPVEAFVVGSERITETRFAAGQDGNATAMVGREKELAVLLDGWREASAGHGKMVVLTGEAGVGKSRIMSALIEAAADQKPLRISYQCSPYHTDTPLYPAVQQLTLAARIDASDLPELKLNKLEALLSQGQDQHNPQDNNAEEAASLLAALLGIAETGQRSSDVSDLPPQQRRAGTLQALLTQLTGGAKQGRAVLFLLEDAHWIDPSTLELLELLLDRLAGKPILVVVTTRPAFEHLFNGHPAVTRLALNRLGRSHIPAIVAQITRGKALPPELMEAIATRTDGVPLYVEEFTKTILASGALRETDNAYVVVGPLNQLFIPSSLHDSLMARLDRLQPLKAVAQTAACIGREFDFGLIAAITSRPTTELIAALDELVVAELIINEGVPPDAWYSFKHALVRDAAYESLLKAKRQAIHGHLLMALKAQGGALPEILAHHAMRAGQFLEAAEYWGQAGDQAMARPAFIEAIAHFERAVQSERRASDDSAGRMRELDLIVKLILALQSGRGIAHPSVAETLAAANKIVDTVGDTPHRFRILAGRWAFENASGNPRSALLHTEGMEREALQTGDRAQQFIVYCFRAVCRFWLGDFAQSDEAFEQAMARHDPQDDSRLIREYGVDQHIWMRCNWALSLMCRGEAKKALRMADGLEATVTGQDNVHTAGSTLVSLALLHQIARSPDRERLAQRSLDYSLENGLTMTERSSRFVLGREFHDQGRYSEAVDRLAENVDWLRESGSRITLSYYLAFYSSTLGPSGLHDEAESIASEVIKMLESSSVQWTAAEDHRTLADANYRDNGTGEFAIDGLRRAVAIADTQGAWLWKLRATNSLARILADQGNTEEALALLRDAIENFPIGGQELADFVDAKSALKALS